MVFRCINIEVYQKSVAETRGHVASLLEVKMAGNDWTDEETQYFLQLIKEKSMATILVRKQTIAVRQDLTNCNANAAADKRALR